MNILRTVLTVLLLGMVSNANALDFDKPLLMLPDIHAVDQYRWKASDNPLFHSFEVSHTKCALTEIPKLEVRIEPFWDRKAYDATLYAAKKDRTWLEVKELKEIGHNLFEVDMGDMPEGDYELHLVYHVNGKRIHLSKNVPLWVLCHRPPKKRVDNQLAYRLLPVRVLAEHVTTFAFDFDKAQQEVELVAFGEEGEMLVARSTTDTALSKGLHVVFENPGQYIVYVLYRDGADRMIDSLTLKVDQEEGSINPEAP